MSDREEVDDLLKEFLLESHDGLDCMERHLNKLRVGADNADCIAEIFRAVHTMKGTVGFLGLGRLGLLAHAGEALLSNLREGTSTLDEELRQLLLQLADRLRAVLHLLETRGHEGRRDADDDAPMIATLERACARVSAHDKGFDGPPSAARSIAAEVAANTAGGNSTVSVEVETLDRLLHIAEELEQTSDRLLRAEYSSRALTDVSHQLDTLSTRLRQCVMHARTQPISHLFQRYPRLARDVATTCGKQVRVELHGGETGFDKSLLNALRDPLTHAVRNAIDHGIESPQIRCAQGKPAEGRVALRASQDASYALVEVHDDGAGINYAKVLRRAVERHLLTPERAARMTDTETLELLFLPGFSTHDQVTMISGRGVGMDVVRANIEHAGGTVDLQSTPGVGTIVRMRIPLALQGMQTSQLGQRE